MGKALQERKQVEVTIDIVYDGANKRPTEFNVKYFIDGKEENVRFSNGGS